MTVPALAITPHEVFTVLRPDEVAECWDGVYSNKVVPDLYQQLWDSLPERASFADNIEDIGPEDVIGLDTVAEFWDRYSPEAQAELNWLAEEQEREAREFFAKLEEALGE